MNVNATGNGKSPVDRLGDVARAIGTSVDAALPPIVPSYRTAGEMIAENPELRAYVVEGLIRSGEVLNIIAAAKMGKSWLIIHLIICIATGRMFLGRFRVARGCVLLLDNELHPTTLAKRIQTVAEAMGVTREEYASTLCVESLRGKGATLDRLTDYFAAIAPGTFKLIVIDAWYRAIPRGMDENANADITSLYNLIDSFAAMTGAAFALIHHSSKGDQSSKSVVDVGSGASAQARAADSHLILRQHEEDDAVVVEAVARSWAPPEPFGMRWQFPKWTVDDTLDVTRLRQPKRGRRGRDAADAAPPEPPPEPWTPARFVAAMMGEEPRPKSVVMARAEMADGLTVRRAAALYAIAIADGLAFEWPDPAGGNALLVATREPSLIETTVPEKPRRGRPPKAKSEGENDR